jgi:serine/threonine-protein kinase
MRYCPKCFSIYSVQVERCGMDGTVLELATSDPLIGQKIDRYRITSRLGAGAMGCVYIGAHANIDREFAIKVLFGEMASNQEVAERFRREAKSLSQIDHPNIVSVVDFGRTENGLLYLVMELVRGRTLGAVIRESASKGEGLLPARAAKLARQIAAGLQEAHRLGFVHRDLKPANIMVVAKGGDEFVKILDFGIVGIVSAEPDSPQASPLTRTGYILGTPAFMAPEQIGRPSVGTSADLYALGATIYAMLCGKPPFDGPVADVFAKKLSQPVPPLPPLGGLERIAMDLLERDPANRPGSVEQVISELDEFVETSFPGTHVSRGGSGSRGGRSPSIPPLSIAEPKSAVEPQNELALRSLEQRTFGQPPETGEIVRRPRSPLLYLAVAAVIGGAAAVGVASLLPLHRTQPAPVESAPAPEPSRAPDPPRASDDTASSAEPPSHEPPKPLETPPEPMRPTVKKRSTRKTAGKTVAQQDPGRSRSAPVEAISPPSPPPPAPTPAPVQPTPTPPPPPPVSTHGSVSVELKSASGASQRAAVFVDDRDIGRLSPLRNYPLPVGKHRIEVRVSAQEHYSKEITVEPDKDVSVRLVGD